MVGGLTIISQGLDVVANHRIRYQKSIIQFELLCSKETLEINYIFKLYCNPFIEHI